VGTARIGQGEMIAASSGGLLLLFMLLDWFSYDEPGDVDSGGYSAWQWMSFLDIVLFLTILVVLGIAIARAADALPGLPTSSGNLLVGAGGLALLVVLMRLFAPGDGPDQLTANVSNVSRSIGVFLGLIAAGGMAFGGWRALDERASGAAPGTRSSVPPPPPPSSAPPSGPPAPGPPASGPPA